jgi:ArsR family transcriptional regulator, arsenate/arsenite/antimonite-responsive transcriptional repressor / arsenate reductase (thioredoxin)
MKITHAVTALAALAQETRLEIYRFLVKAGDAGLSAGQIGAHFHSSGATVSFHLKNLKHAGLIQCERDGRSLIYRADYAVMNALLGYLTENCCGGAECNLSASLTAQGHVMTSKIYNVLFLCTGNSARSILAESLMRCWGQGKFNAFSAGSTPTGAVNPLALELLARFNMPQEGLRSKGWDEFAQADAPHLDFVITVCDKAAGEVCPVWPGQPITAHWGAPDPAAVTGTAVEKMMAFREVYRILENRIKIFTALRIEGLERLRLKEEMDSIGQCLPSAE